MMMSFNTTKTVREIAVETPNATRIFEKLKIDYCCGGHRPLQEVCAEVGLETGEVLRLIEESAQSTAQAGAADFQTAPISALMTYIVDKHHVFTREEITRITALLAKVCSRHGENHTELMTLQTLFQELANDLMPHMLKEENILFPYIARLEEARRNNLPAPQPPFGSVRNPVRMMMMEHDTAGDLLRKIRETSTDFSTPPDACISYQTLYQALEGFEQDVHQHIHLENNILFPRAVEIEDAFLA
jgi:regulator of cell morphogenesis and NO signaling